jgi:ribosomal protein S18 acetylase RimI-like enzyme
MPRFDAAGWKDKAFWAEAREAGDYATNGMEENQNRRTQPPPPFTFRAGTEADFPRCAELWMLAVALRDGTHNDPRVKRRAMAKLTATGSILSIAESSSRTLGFALAVEKAPPDTARTAHLTLLAVDPTSQSRGLGRFLLANITHSLVMEGFSEVTLGVLEENLAARKIYEIAGWRITGRGVFEDSGRPCVHYSLGLKAAAS